MELSLSRSLPGGSTVRVPLHIPMEVLTTICGFASASPINLDMDEMDCLFEDPWRIRAVQRMRLVSKIFNSAASPFLIQQVYLTPNHDSVDRLNNIADSVFGKHVRSVWIDCRLFNEDICSRPADYANALNTTSMFSMYPKEKLRDGFRTYCELAAKQQECCERGLHIDCLVNAFTKMPNLQTAVMSSRHRPWHMRRSYRRLLSFRPPGIPGGNPGQYDYMVEPDAIFFSAEDAQRSTHREKYLTLTSEYLQALSRPAIASRIKSLKVSTLDPSHPMSTFTGVFGGLNHFHTSLKFMFGGLRKLDLSLSRGLLPAIIDPNTDSDDTSAKAWQRLLKDCLGAAQQIKVLSLSFLTYPRDAYRDMTDILETLSFPHLRTVKLAGSAFKERTLSKFIIDHASTLKNVTLRCELTQGGWESYIASIKAHVDTHFETFALESCSENTRSLGHPRGRSAYLHFEASSEVMLDYLYAEGFNPLVQVSVDDLLLTPAGEDPGQ